MIVGAGPVGGTLALAIADADLDVVALDARAAGSTLRGDRSLAMSHGARLIFERLGVWARLARCRARSRRSRPIDISQAGGVRRREADGVRAGDAGARLRHLLSRAAGRDRRRARAHAHRDSLRNGRGERRRARRCMRRRRSTRRAASRVLARLAVVADGTGAAVAGVSRERRDYGQVALIAKVGDRRRRTKASAYERFTPTGPVALLPEGDRYGLVWTMTPSRGGARAGLVRRASSSRSSRATLARAAAISRACANARRFHWRSNSRGRDREPLRPDRQCRAVAASDCGTGLQPRAARRLRAFAGDQPRCARCARQPRHARGLRLAAARRSLCGHRVHARPDAPVRLRRRAAALAARPRADSLLDAVPVAKRAFTRAMLFGLLLNARSLARFARGHRGRATARSRRTRDNGAKPV